MAASTRRRVAPLPPRDADIRVSMPPSRKISVNPPRAAQIVHSGRTAYARAAYGKTGRCGMAYATYEQAIAKKARADGLLRYVVSVLARLQDGEAVDLDFIGREDVGAFCRALGFAEDRNWAALSIDQIATEDESGARVVPEDEAAKVLAALKTMLARGALAPSAEGTPSPHVLNDFLPAGTRYRGRRCLGHTWEWRYALAVELEHGRYHGTNVTNNHPILTGMVVLAHLAEDRLYYARLWVMETEGELFNAQLEHKPFAELREILMELQRAQEHRNQRIDEVLAHA